MLIQINNGTFYYNEKLVFKDVSLQLNEGDRIGLLGRNGEGKTTLINSLLKRLTLRDGTIINKSDLAVGYLQQNSGLDSTLTVLDEMRKVFEDVTDCEKSMRILEQEMSALDHDSVEYKRKASLYDAKNNFFIARDGYNIETKIKTILTGMGFNDKFDQIINTMSGGEKTRLALCRLLLINPELLILDEPTNHLDFSTLIWLETYLASYKGALLIVSHDRLFLDKLVNRIWDMENFGVTPYIGNYSKYKVLKAEKLLTQQREYEKQQKQISAMEEYVDKNMVRASTSKSARSRVKQLANMDVLDKPYIDNRSPRFLFDMQTEPLKNVITVRDLTLYGGDKLLLNNVSLEVLRGEKVALIGSNGTGKSTFIKSIVNSSNDDWSKIKFGKGVKYSYYDQENLNLTPTDTVLEAIWNTHHRMQQSEVRKILAQVLLSEEDVNKRVSQLSGGQRAKLGLAMMIIEHANTLILDEPTNHLDLDSRESLEEGLKNFHGTILFVSHDRYFINQIATKVVEIDNHTLVEYVGDFDDYNKEKQKNTVKIVESEQTKKEEKTTSTFVSPQKRKAIVNAKIELKTVETDIENLEQKEKDLYQAMSSSEVVNDYKLMQSKCDELDETKKMLEEKLQRWEELTQLIEN